MIKFHKPNLFPLSNPGTFGGHPIRYESAYETAQAQLDAERASAEAAAAKAQEEQRIADQKAAAELAAAGRAAAERAHAQAIAEQKAAGAKAAEAARVAAQQAYAERVRAAEEAAEQEAEDRRHARHLRVRRAAYRRRRELALQPPPLPPSASPLEYHQRNCTICPHPDRKAIEESFLRWDSPAEIAEEYEISRSAVYRHASALELFDRRSRNVRFALGHVIEESSRVMPTADAIIRAVRAFTRVNDQGQWIDPPQHFVISPGPRLAGPADLPIGLPLAQCSTQLTSDHAETMSDEARTVTLLPASTPGFEKREEPDQPGHLEQAEDPSTQPGTPSWTHPHVTP